MRNKIFEKRGTVKKDERKEKKNTFGIRRKTRENRKRKEER